MRVLLTGATGFIGRALVPALLGGRHSVVAWARSPRSARAGLGADAEIIDARAGFDALAKAVDGCDAVVNLTGESLMGGRWTTERRQALRDSRIEATAQLVRAIEAASRPPRVLVSGSAIGFYGDRGDDQLDEGSGPDSSFLSVLCQDWEAAAERAARLGVRVVCIRTSVVLGREGGALASMLPAFRLGLGGPLGAGRQYFPWIHLQDFVQIIVAALHDDRFNGPVNAVAPEAVTNRVFTRALGDVLHRPAVVPVPAFGLRLIFGAAATTLLGSQRLRSVVLERLGFGFRFPTLASALTDIVGGVPVDVGGMAGPVEAQKSDVSRRYLLTRPPTHELRTTTYLQAPLAEAFAFFSKAENLGLITPPSMRLVIKDGAPAPTEGAVIDYDLRVGPLPMTWRSRIVDWTPGERFVDIQERGPYRCWWHEHTFRADGEGTMMADRVCYAPPFGLFGRIANRLFIVPMLRRIFRYRADVIRLRFLRP